MIKQNFFDELDKDFDDVLSNTYKNHAKKCFMNYKSKTKERYVVLKNNNNISLEKDNIIEDISTDCISSYINDYNKLNLTHSRVFNDTLYLSIDSSYISNMYEDEEKINNFSNINLDDIDVAYISLNEIKYEITLHPLENSYLVRKYVCNDPTLKYDMRLNSLSIKYFVQNDTFKLDNTKYNISLDKKFFEVILDKIKYIPYSILFLYKHFKTFIDKIEEKTDLFD